MNKYLSLIIGILFFFAGVLYSYRVYTDETFLPSVELIYGNISDKQLPMNEIEMEKLIGNRGFAGYAGLVEKNIFLKNRGKEKKVIKKNKVIKIPKIDIPKAPEKKEEKAVEPDEVYYYRGTVIIGGRETYVIDREGDRKTFFVHKGDKLRDFMVLDTDAKKVVISDYKGKIKILKKISKKEYMEQKNKSEGIL